MKLMPVVQLMKKWLHKKTGSNDFFKLTDAEKVSYRQMEEALTERSLTEDDVYNFFSKAMNEAEEKIVDPALPMQVREFHIVELRVYKNIIKFLDAPKLKARNARMMLEKQLSE